MSTQGEPGHRDEDEWWQQLYGAPTGDTAPADGADTVDDRFDGVHTMISPPRRETAEGPATARVPSAEGTGAPAQQAPPAAGGAFGPAPTVGPAPEPTPEPTPVHRPQPPAPQPPAPAPGDPHPAGQGAHDPAPPPAQPPVEQPPAPEPPAAEPHVVEPAAVATPAPAVPQPRDPRLSSSFRLGPVAPPEPLAPAVHPAGEPPSHVGDRPPTYDPEPTAWPTADPEDLESLTPDTVLDGARYGRLTVRIASVRGDSARYRGEPRRDAVLAARFGEADDALVLLAVASGSRSAEGSHRAAREACRWIASAVGRHSERLALDIRSARRGALKSGLHRLTDRCLGQLRLHAQEAGQDPDGSPASLRCLLLPADPHCNVRVFFGVGPGGLFRLREDQWQDLEPLAPGARVVPGTAGEVPPEPGAAGEVAPPAFRFRASVARPGDALMLCSEGMAAPLRGEPALAAALAERWAAPHPPPGLAGFLGDVQIRVKGFADDRTACVVWES
ncbi:protein phosphatase 2C domain-containing protein [Wenjunlia vitaminophila]|uniref:protein phosphatase 2C domain-containing protein n=1 Tax=Wenjunlia vitaminophila TaxID=76728 RepID=UPI000366A45E|nr:protein phosphatase 2C domain-containing protein [Wenjunlia vitaminophila]